MRGRVAEGAPLLREYSVNSSIEGSNPSVSSIISLITYILLMPYFEPSVFKKIRRDELDSNPFVSSIFFLYSAPPSPILESDFV